MAAEPRIEAVTNPDAIGSDALFETLDIGRGRAEMLRHLCPEGVDQSIRWQRVNVARKHGGDENRNSE